MCGIVGTGRKQRGAKRASSKAAPLPTTAGPARAGYGPLGTRGFWWPAIMALPAAERRMRGLGRIACREAASRSGRGEGSRC